MVNFINADKTVRPYKKEIKKLFSHTCDYLGQPDYIAVTVKFVNKEEIKNINARCRNIDKITDVLSFPFLNISAGDVINKEDFPFDLDNDEIYLGDIAVCTEKAAEQAEEYGHSFKRELFYLILHGFLHLLGYDHMTEDDKKLMRLKEEEILTGMDIE